MEKYKYFILGFLSVILTFIILPLCKVFTIVKLTEYIVVVGISAIIMGFIFQFMKGR